jgi:predicted NBD/HSP70 family sugar kinase
METKIKVIMLTNLTETEQKVFQLIWYKKYGISRTEIVNKTKLSKATVSRAVDKLISNGFVVEGDAVPTTSKGRPQKLLVLRNDEILISGISIHSRFLHFVIGDLSGRLRYSENIPVDKSNVVSTIMDFPKYLEKNYNSLYRNIKVFSIVTPGQVDQVNMKVTGNFFSVEKDVYFSGLEDCWNILFKVENDVNALLSSQIMFGHLKYKNIFLIDSEFGGALVIDGKMVRGLNGGAGEFGHTQLIHDGPLCWCGKKGCVSNYFGADNLKSIFHSTIPASYMALFGRDFSVMLSELYNEKFSKEFCILYEKQLDLLADAIVDFLDLLCIDNLMLNTENPFFKDRSFEYISEKMRKTSGLKDKLKVMPLKIRKGIEIPLAISLTKFLGENIEI